MSFAEKLQKRRAGLKGWQATPRTRLRSLGRTLTSEEVVEALHRLNELAQERARIAADPELNCDDEDDMHFAQKEVSVALQHLKRTSANSLLIGLQSNSSSVRFWTAIALRYSGLRSHIPELQKALALESDDLNKRVLNDAISSLRNLPRGPIGLLVRAFRPRRDA